jgi:NADH-quinone oxidoreductase subunit I
MGAFDGFKGFAVTFAKLNKKSATGAIVTTDYNAGRAKEGKTDNKRPKALRLHGRHVLNRYEDGMEKCIGCELCAGVCPAKCIYVRGADNDPEDPTSPGERFGFIYEINYLRCIHCDLCVEACPTQAITESKLFEFSFTSREQAIYTKDELVVGDDGNPQHLPWEDWRPGEDQDTSAWMRATSSSGSAAYEGKVGWSGELGYGVRAPELGQTADDLAPGPDPQAGDADTSNDGQGAH